MNKIINSPDTILEDMMQGYLYLCGGDFTGLDDIPGTIVKKVMPDKVCVVVGGGGGNEPWVLGFAGKGLADAVISGNVYMAPPAGSILEMSRRIYHEKGILYIATNHMGDVLNFGLVGELAALEHIDTRCVFVNDDTASSENPEDRRGVAGACLVVKMAGAASEMGGTLEEAAAMAQKTNQNLRTLAVTTSPGYLPGNGKAMCELPEGMMEYGMGFAGEPGIRREKLGTAKEIIGTMMDLLLTDLHYEKGQQVAVWLNGFGFTSILEQCILMKEIKAYATEKGVDVYDVKMKELFRPQGTGGFSLSVLRLEEDMKPCYDWEASSPMFDWQRGQEL